MPGDRPVLRSPAAVDGAVAASADPAAGDANAKSAEAAAPRTHSWTSWRNLWQIPTILVSVALIVIGLRSAMRPPLADDFDGALAQVEHFITAGQVEPAFAQMRVTIEPHIDRGSSAQRAHFHALSGDLTFASQETSDIHSEDNNRHIIKEYGLAEELGEQLSPARLERWGEALVNVGDLDGAREKLGRLRKLMDSPAEPVTPVESKVHTENPHDAAPSEHAAPSTPEVHPETHAGHDDHSAGEPEAHAPPDAHAQSPPHEEIDQRSAAIVSHGRLFRRIIDAQFLRPDVDSDELMEALAEYRFQSHLDQPQRVWAAARLAELRLENGHATAAIDGLMVEMRRLEGDAGAKAHLPFGELYLLLGRAYYELGETEKSQQHLDQALHLLGASEAPRGDALVFLGQIALAAGDYDAAFERFNTVANEFVTTRSHLPGVLGRAEAESLLGDHAAAQADFREVAAMLKRSRPRRDVTPERVAQRLCDRHDAALALGRMERAIEYVSIAESLFPAAAVLPDVLFRLASTNRQMAENMLVQAGADKESVLEPVEIDPATRYEINRRLEQAGNDYLRHVSAETTKALNEEEWGASLWAAAECFDRGGRHDRAIAQFEKYLGSRTADDPRRAEAMFRIAQAHQARMEYDEAAHWYEQVLTDRSRSSFAARCHVPLARCQLALNQVDEAKATLEQVLAGERLLDPDARDYRDALIEVGRLHHDQGAHVEAIERLTEAVKRYPDDERIADVQYLLADSYRASAVAIAKRLEEERDLSAAEGGRLAVLRADHLRKAQELFSSLASQPDREKPPSQRDLARRAHLYQADCAFDLGEFEHAVELYESASRQYSDDASSMYALVQIVNCYSALGDARRAEAAHERALSRLKQLPDSAFNSPNALMDRTAWERWLLNSPAGGFATVDAGTSS